MTLMPYGQPVPATATLLREVMARGLWPELEARLKYSPDQPRVPAGSPDGGQWVSGGGGAEQDLSEPGDSGSYVTNDEIPDYPGRQLSDHLSKVQHIPAAQISITEGGKDEEKIARLKTLMAAGEPLPAIVVEFTGEEADKDLVSILDGHHRYWAAKDLGMTVMPVRVMVQQEDWAQVQAGGGLRIRKSNDCHEPAGSPAGGQFCGDSSGGGATTLPARLFRNVNGKPSVANRVEAQLRRLPPQIVDRLDREGVTVEVVDRIDGHNTIGLYRDSDKTIFVGSRFRGPTGDIPNRLPDETVVHEIGHALDRHTPGFLRSATLTTTFKAEYDTLPAHEQHQMAHFILNGKESLARTFSHLYAEKGAGISKGRFAKKFPKSIALLRARLTEVGL